MFVFDAHTHLGRGDEHYGAQSLWDRKTHFLADDMIRLMDECGIDKVVAFGLGRPVFEDRIQPVIDAVQRYPERFVGFFWANPREADSVAADKIGIDRVIYGSDAPLHHPRVELTKIDVAGLPPEDKAKVLGGNIARLLGVSPREGVAR